MNPPTSELPSPPSLSDLPPDVSPLDGETLDLSLPTSALFQVAEGIARKSAQPSAGVMALLAGKLSKEEYTRLWHLYETLETALDSHASHPAIAPLYNPAVLKKTDLLSADIAVFLGAVSDDPAVWQEHPLYLSFLPFPPLVQTYISRITSIASTPEGVHRIVAHAYIRYLGDFSGGQVIKRVVAKTYDLEDGQGTSFLDFAGLTGPAGKNHATYGDVNKLKEWFKDGLDTGVMDGEEKKAVVEEAILAFKYNQGLFGLLKAPEGETSKIAMIKFLGIIWLEQVIAACKQSFGRLVKSGHAEFTLNPSVIPVSVIAFGVSYLALRILK